MSGSGTTNYLPKYTGTNNLGNSVIYETGSNIGIGTTSPAQPLHVVRTTSGYAVNITTQPGASGRHGLFVTAGNSATDNVVLFQGNVAGQNFVLKQSGNVGIGTTLPNATLDVDGSLYVRGEDFRVYDTGTTTRYADIGVDVGGTYYGTEIRNQGAIQAIFENQGMSLGYAGSVDVPNTGAIIAGDVGIGTTNPANKLDVVGNANLSANSPTLYFTDDTRTGAIYVQSNKMNFYDSSGGQDEMTIDLTNGRVGIGTTSPAQLLHVEDGEIMMRRSGNARMYVEAYSTTDSYTPALYFLKSGHGTIGTYDTTVDGEVLGLLQFDGIDTDDDDRVAAKIYVYQDGDATGSDVPARFEFQTEQGTPAGTATRLTIKGDGKVGINTTSPQYLLDVAGDARFGGDMYLQGQLTIQNVTTLSVNGSLIPPTDDLYDIGSATYEWKDAYIDGTLNADNIAMGGSLDMDGNELVLDADADTSFRADTDDQIDVKVAGAYDFAFKANEFLVQSGSDINIVDGELVFDSSTSDGGDSVTTLYRDGNQDLIMNSKNDIVFDYDSDNNANGYMAFQSGNSEIMRIDNSGNVGIGTASPSYKLSVVDSDDAVLEVKSSSANKDAQIRLYETDGDVGFNINYDGSSTNNLEFNSNAVSQAMVIVRDTGNVGINTTSPQTLLHVFGDASSQLAVQTSRDNRNASIRFVGQDPADMSTEQAIVGYDGANNRFFIATGSTNYPSEKLVIDRDTGNVAIGSSSTDANRKLYVTGTSRFTDNIYISTNTAGKGIIFGNQADTNLYRSAANVLKTDDRFEVNAVAGINVTGSQANLYLDETDQTTPAGRFVLRGNSDLFNLMGRKADNSDYENIFTAERIADGGLVTFSGSDGINVGTITHSDLDLVGFRSARSPSGLDALLQDDAGTTIARWGDENPNMFRVEKDLIVVDDKVGIGTTDPQSDFVVIGNMHLNDTSPVLNFIDDADQRFNFTINEADDSFEFNFPKGALSAEWNDGDGTAIMTLLEGSGNLGIGTASPSQKLEVAGNVYANGGTFITSTGIAYNVDGDNKITFDNNIHFFTADSNERMTIKDTTGNVGIGTVSPNYPLDVAGDARITGDLYIQGFVSSLNVTETHANSSFIPSENKTYDLGNTSHWWRDAYIGDDLYVQDQLGVGTRTPSEKLEISGGNLRLDGDGMLDPYIIGKSSAGATRIYLHTNADSYINGGNLGIGTASPGAALDVQSGEVIRIKYNGNPQLSLDTTSSSGLPQIAFRESGTQRANIAYSVSSNYLGISSDETGSSLRLDGDIYMSFATSGSEQARITADGFLGINTTSPGELLSVEGGQSSFGEATAGNAIPIVWVKPQDTKPYAGITIEGPGTSVNWLTMTHNGTEALIETNYLGGGSATDLELRAYANFDQLVLETDGDVGIGVANPSKKFTVGHAGGYGGYLGMSTLADAGLGDSTLIEFREGSGPAGGAILYSGGSSAPTVGGRTFSGAPANALYIIANDGSTDRNAIVIPRDTGNVGIGETSPDKALHVTTTADKVAVFEDNDNPIIILRDANAGANAKHAGLKFNSQKLSMVSSPDNYSGETEYLTVDTSNGDVGIGTTSPSSRLHVVKHGTEAIAIIDGEHELSRSSVLRFVENPSGTFNNGYLGGFVRYDASANKLHIGTQNSQGTDTADDIDVITILRDGTNVGIGDTSPDAKLDVAGSVHITGASNGIHLSSNYDTDYGIRLVPVDNGVNGHELRVRGRTTSTGSFSDLVTFENNGDVGIGTVNPVDILHVQKASSGRSTWASNFILENSGDAFLALTGGTSHNIGIRMGDSNGEDPGFIAFNTASDYMQFGTSGAEQMRLDSAGNFGIGETTPETTLHVDGDVIIEL